MTTPLCIIGPTASGKTDAALNIAKSIGAEIISADSMQVYRYMNIGTAKPSSDMLSQIPHHLIDIRNPDETYSVFDFVKDTYVLIDRLRQVGKPILIVGGTGLYFHALFHGLSFSPVPADSALREELSLIPTHELFSRLQTVDPLSAARIHPHNQKRVIRALEVFYKTGIPLSAQVSRKDETHRYRIIGMDIDKAVLHARIFRRAEQMVREGLVEEVRSLLKCGYSPDLPAMQGVGYKETVAYLNGKLATTDDLISLIALRTRQFAKRQMTWFRRFAGVQWRKGEDKRDIMS